MTNVECRMTSGLPYACTGDEEVQGVVGGVGLADGQAVRESGLGGGGEGNHGTHEEG